MDGNVSVIQMKDLGYDNTVSLTDLVKSKIEYPKQRQYIKKSDIIFRARGQNLTAAILNHDISDSIVSAPLIRIRANTSIVLPEFLWWSINQRSSQVYLTSQSKGTMLKLVSKKVLEDLEITLPSLDQQNHIIKFIKLARQERNLLSEIQKKRALVSEATITKLIKEAI
jgi:restriction endonuclease S subunit